MPNVLDDGAVGQEAGRVGKRKTEERHVRTRGFPAALKEQREAKCLAYFLHVMRDVVAWHQDSL